MKTLKPKEMASCLGISVKTLQSWDKKGLLVAKRTPTNRRYYTYAQLIEYQKDHTLNSDLSKLWSVVMKMSNQEIRLLANISLCMEKGGETYANH